MDKSLSPSHAATPTTPDAPDAPDAPDIPRREYSSELKLDAVRSFLEEGMTRREVVEVYDIASISTLKKWVIAYKREGAAALAVKSKGRHPKPPVPEVTLEGLTPFEELILHAENNRLARKLRG